MKLDRHIVCLLILLSLGTMPVPVWTEVHSITATGEYKVGVHDSLEDAKRLAFLNAKALAIGQAVQFLAEQPAVKQLGLNADCIVVCIMSSNSTLLVKDQEKKERGLRAIGRKDK